MELYIEQQRSIYEQVELRSIDATRCNIIFNDGSVTEVHGPTFDIRTSHIGLSGFVREGGKQDFRQVQFDCYPTKPRSK